MGGVLAQADVQVILISSSSSLFSFSSSFFSLILVSTYLLPFPEELLEVVKSPPGAFAK